MIAAEMGTLEQLIKAQAYGLGFDLVGIAALGPVETANAFDDWVASGYAGEMDYLVRGAEKRADTGRPVPGARSAIVVGLDYGGREPSGPVARYARGDDYHDVMVDRLRELHRYIESVAGGTIPGKAYVDTGPILERDLARRAGLGWFGKNTMLLNPRIGSFFFLGACPTSAFPEPRVLDATRCISYLTIELKGEIDETLQPPIGDRLYGCDVCQDVCPWNQKFARPVREDAFRPRPAVAGKDARTLARDILALSDDEFKTAYKNSPMKRAKLRGLRRNAAVVLGHDAGLSGPV